MSKTPNSPFISNSVTVTDHKTSLSSSFGSCTSEMKIIKFVYETYTLQELPFLIQFNLVDYSGTSMYFFFSDLNTEGTIVI